MKSNFSKNFVVPNFLKLFFIVAPDNGLVYPETCFNSSLNSWQYFCCDQQFTYYFLTFGTRMAGLHK